MSNRRVVANIDLSAIEHNIKCLYNHMPVPKPIIAVIKADGYGHGATQIANRLEGMTEIYGFATATTEEALTLRNAGISKPILILGYVFEEDYRLIIENDISIAIFDYESAKKYSEIATSINKTAKAHLKVDTGMSRIGVFPDESGLHVAKLINELQNIKVEGVFTHFARADELNLDAANKQLEAFTSFVTLLKENNICPDIVHCANSAAILQIPDAQISVVRAGIVIYGLWPSEEMMSVDIDLKPAMSLVSHIAYIKEIKAGRAVSYGGTYVAPTDVRIATIPVGYADGYPRGLSNKGYVLINGQRAPIVGRVCMDQFMVNITDIEANRFDEVILLGSSGGENITAEELGDISGRFNYELVCDITSRVPRIYD